MGRPICSRYCARGVGTGRSNRFRTTKHLDAIVARIQPFTPPLADRSGPRRQSEWSCTGRTGGHRDSHRSGRYSDLARKVLVPRLREDQPALARFHSIPRGWARSSLSATIAYEKLGGHQPLDRLSERFVVDDVSVAQSTLADTERAITYALKPIKARLEAHVFAAERRHGDDTSRIWAIAEMIDPLAGSIHQRRWSVILKTKASSIRPSTSTDISRFFKPLPIVAMMQSIPAGEVLGPLCRPPVAPMANDPFIFYPRWSAPSGAKRPEQNR